MKVALVSEHASPLAVLGGVDAGGQNVHVAALADALAALGHSVVVYTRRDDPRLAERVRLPSGVTVHHLTAGPARAIAKDELFEHIPALAASLRAALARTSPDVVHAHFWMSGIAALEATRGSMMPVLQTFHALGATKQRFQGTDDSSPPERIPSEAALVRRTRRIIATCTEEVAELKSMGADASRVDVIPCGVDSARFCAAGPAAPRGDLHRLLVVSRLVPRKGIADAIRALALVPGAELVVAGGPAETELAVDPEASRLRRLAAELGVGARLRLLGGVPRDELAGWLRSADLLLCLPWYEPFGIVPVEAMACGTPVVGTAVGGLLDTVVDGGTGVLLPSHRPDLVAATVRRLLADRCELTRLGAAGAERARHHYGWASIAAATEASYRAAAADVGPVRDLTAALR